uniref:Uncharacterized protein n=1 Tax=Spongospora subterranea TaxID=70186 RepID=A0A0H5RF97_9EUKA|eukprot:CRZ12391.1 hypothetical protein [Spongospora subterranea]
MQVGQSSWAQTLTHIEALYLSVVVEGRAHYQLSFELCAIAFPRYLGFQKGNKEEDDIVILSANSLFSQNKSRVIKKKCGIAYSLKEKKRVRQGSISFLKGFFLCHGFLFLTSD